MGAKNRTASYQIAIGAVRAHANNSGWFSVSDVAVLHAEEAADELFKNGELERRIVSVRSLSKIYRLAR